MLEQIDHHLARRPPARASSRAPPVTAAEAGRDRSRHDVADADVVVPDLLHQRFAERVQPGLRRAVRRAAGERVLAGQAADVDDPAAAAPAQLRESPRGSSRTRRSDSCRSSAASRRSSCRRRSRTTPTPALLTRMSRPPNVFTASPTARAASSGMLHVGADGVRSSVPSGTLVDGRVERRLIPPGDHDARAGCGQRLRDRQADALRSARDQRDLAFARRDRSPGPLLCDAVAIPSLE